MRNVSSRLHLERVFVLGAGASYAATTVVSRKAAESATYEAPLDRNFCARIATINVQKPQWVKEACNRVVKAWRHETAFVDHGLEEAVLLQLANLEFLRAIHPKRAHKLPSPYEWVNDLAHVMCVILRRCRQNGKRLLDEFAEKVVNDCKQGKCRLITFNYDILLDKVLLNRFSERELYFDTIGDGVRTEKYPYLILLKLHGSINWRCASKDMKQIIEGKIESSVDNQRPFWIDKVEVDHTSLPSPDDDEISPLIIPPLPNKPISQVALFRYLWTRAYEYLYEAKEIDIIGYSLPDADQMAQAMFRNFRGGRRLEKVVVVDPDPAVLARWKTALRGTRGSKVQWLYYETFDEYMQGGSW